MKKKWIAVIIGVVLATVAGVAISHGGALDKFGCHHDYSTGTYHCHR